MQDIDQIAGTVRPSLPARTTRRIAAVQGCRGIAALMVILAHDSSSIFSRTKYWPHNPVGHWLDWTHLGVEFFFVISGFIIGDVHAGDIGRPDRILNFLRKRFLRIYPLYWIVLGLLLPLYFAYPSFGQGFEKNPNYIASSALLINWLPLSRYGQAETILGVAWTLYHEILFYSLFIFLLIGRRIGVVVLALWFSACIVDLLFGPFGGMTGLYLAPRNLIFGMGLFSAYALRRWRIPAPGACLAVGLTMFFGAALQELPFHLLSIPVESLTCGVGAMLAVLGLVELERSRDMATPRFLTTLGDASYSIYLIHFPVLILLGKVAIGLRRHVSLPVDVWYLLFFAIALAAGLGMHYGVERPLLRRLRIGTRRAISRVHGGTAVEPGHATHALASDGAAATDFG